MENFRLPYGKRLLRCDWIFTVNHKAIGEHRLVEGKTGCKGIHLDLWHKYQEAFPSEVKLNSVRVLLSLVANSVWFQDQLNVTNGFLNDDLEEGAYMEIPPVFECGSYINNASKLRKSMYVLKQSPRALFERHTKAVKKHFYSRGYSDRTPFVKYYSDGKLLF